MSRSSDYVMEFSSPLRRATLLRRYKRFLADVRTPDGALLTIHCANTGAMSGCAEPGSAVWYSRSERPGRKYPHTWELVETAQGRLVGVNTARANELVAEALRAGGIRQALGSVIRSEVPIADERGRFDFAVTAPDGSVTAVEVKSLTLSRERGLGEFPDARSERATRHVRALQRVSLAGQRAVLIFCVQHSGVQRVTTADDIDPEYGAAVREARAAGVLIVAYATDMSPRGMALRGELRVF
jgi:sugar fermentation stimulation protein A